MHSSQIYKKSKNILLRYEEGIDSGTFFIFNVINNELWCGNLTSKRLIEIIDGKKNVQELKGQLCSTLGIEMSNELSACVDNILIELLEKEMVFIIENDSN